MRDEFETFKETKRGQELLKGTQDLPELMRSLRLNRANEDIDRNYLPPCAVKYGPIQFEPIYESGAHLSSWYWVVSTGLSMK